MEAAAGRHSGLKGSFCSFSSKAPSTFLSVTSFVSHPPLRGRPGSGDPVGKRPGLGWAPGRLGPHHAVLPAGCVTVGQLFFLSRPVSSSVGEWSPGEEEVEEFSLQALES